VPMVKDAVRRVDPAGRRIEVNGEFLGLAEAPHEDPHEDPSAEDRRGN